MVLRLKMTLAFAATALMAVVVSFALAAMIQTTFLAALLSMIIAGAIGAGFGYVFGGTTAQALSDLNGVILRFIKWTWTAWSRMRRAPMRWATSPRL